MKEFVVAIVGRPNVGKSSLLNALLGFRRSIVVNAPGTTRDEVSELIDWGTGDIRLADNLGIWEEKDLPILIKVLKKADAVLFVTDAVAGITPFDSMVGEEIRKTGLPTLVLVNKIEGKKTELHDSFSVLGFSDVLGISTAHRTNLDAVKGWASGERATWGEPGEKSTVKPLKIALIGKPNSGKSTLMNRLVGHDVSAVSPEALTTRDPVIEVLNTPIGPIRLIDTAGIRRPRSQEGEIEVFSVQASKRMVREADVVFLLIAAHEPVSDQDMRLLNMLEDEGKPLAILLNFWDILSSEERKQYLENSDFSRHIKHLPILQISGFTGLAVEKLLPLARKLKKGAERRIKTSQLNAFVKKMVAMNPPPSLGAKNFNILYSSQVQVDPPTFVFFLNRKEALPPSYVRYVTNSLRKNLGFKGQTIRVHFRCGRSDRPSAPGHGRVKNR